ncbi:MAG: tetratricopeptide repeat protein [Candidatus Omnitrophota bacterium]|nr:MAG: tetratricopeptide repeat protein [Candidatus Omnitrophota bacterium]
MKRFWRIISSTIFLSLMMIPLSFAAKGEKEIIKANKLYSEGEFREALKVYSEALALNPNSDVINFNRATALYKTGNYREAGAGFTNVLITDNPKLQAKATYNIGNSKYKQGELKESTDLTQAISLYTEALNYYRRAIELDEEDRDAKYNYEFVKRKLKTLKEKTKHMPKPRQKEQPQPEAKEKPQKQQEPEKGEAPREQDERPQPVLERDEMSEQEARMLLEGQEEKEIGEVITEKSKRPYPEVLKHW